MLDGGGASVGAQQRISAARSSNRLIRPRLERVLQRRTEKTVPIWALRIRDDAATSCNHRLYTKMEAASSVGPKVSIKNSNYSSNKCFLNVAQF